MTPEQIATIQIEAIIRGSALVAAAINAGAGAQVEFVTERAFALETYLRAQR